LLWLALCGTAWAQKLEQGKPLRREAEAEPKNWSDIAGADVAAARSEANDRLRGLQSPPGRFTPATSAGATTGTPGAASQPGASVAQPVSAAPASASESTAEKSIRELLTERVGWLDEYEKLTQSLQKALSPDPNPEKQRSEAQKELLQLQQTLNQAAVSLDALLPPAFRNARSSDASSVAAEMRSALEAERNDLKQWAAKLESLRIEIVKAENLRSARRSERDKLFQRAATLKAKNPDVRDRVTTALTSEARQLAQEKLVNFEWEARVENLRLQVTEAELALDRKIAGVRELNLQICQVQVQILEKRGTRMEALYKAIAERQEQDLSRAAASEETKARRTDDPLEGFKARRTADLLSLEALVIKSDQVLATSPSPSLHEQRELADRAEADFAAIKQLLDDGEVSRLDAVRLNNEFRRIALERERLLRNEKTAVEAHLQFYEEAVTSTEIELLSDSASDRFDRDLLRDRLPQSRWTEAEAMLEDLERKHRALLERRRDNLQRLCDRASQTHQQIVRRLAILDEEYGFIRTHIFWVRDQEPLGWWALPQGGREIQQLLRACFRLAQETAKLKVWGQPSGEFAAISFAVFVLPLGIVRLRRVLHRLLEPEPGR
jgi:potassium efflux system protein